MVSGQLHQAVYSIKDIDPRIAGSTVQQLVIICYLSANECRAHAIDFSVVLLMLDQSVITLFDQLKKVFYARRRLGLHSRFKKPRGEFGAQFARLVAAQAICNGNEASTWTGIRRALVL